jgi:hypothetical protein
MREVILIVSVGGEKHNMKTTLLNFFSLTFFAVLGLEFRAYTLSHSTSPFL